MLFVEALLIFHFTEHEMETDPEFWRMPTVVQKTGMSKSQIYALAAAGRFPRARSYSHGGQSRFFVSTEVQAWMRAQLVD